MKKFIIPIVIGTIYIIIQFHNDDKCGDGTVLRDGKCVPDEPIERTTTTATHQTIDNDIKKRILGCSIGCGTICVATYLGQPEPGHPNALLYGEKYSKTGLQLIASLESDSNAKNIVEDSGKFTMGLFNMAVHEDNSKRFRSYEEASRYYEEARNNTINCHNQCQLDCGKYFSRSY